MKLALIASIIQATLDEFPGEGMPGGKIYAAILGIVSYDEFERIMSALVTAGVVKKRGHQYFSAKERK
jgi:hypothetical protein